MSLSACYTFQIWRRPAIEVPAYLSACAGSYVLVAFTLGAELLSSWLLYRARSRSQALSYPFLEIYSSKSDRLHLVTTAEF